MIISDINNVVNRNTFVNVIEDTEYRSCFSVLFILTLTCKVHPALPAKLAEQYHETKILYGTYTFLWSALKFVSTLYIPNKMLIRDLSI